MEACVIKMHYSPAIVSQIIFIQIYRNMQL